MKVRITFTPNRYTEPDTDLSDVIEGDVIHTGSTVIETGHQLGEFFAVPCLVVDTSAEILHIPLRLHDRWVHVENTTLCGYEV